MTIVDAYKIVSRTLRNIRLYASVSGGAHSILPPKNVSHANWPDYLAEQYNKSGMRVLEIGSRVVTGSGRANVLKWPTKPW
jgi:hypothetical protein